MYVYTLVMYYECRNATIIVVTMRIDILHR